MLTSIPSVLVCIVNYKSALLVERCLESLTDDLIHSIVIWNNDSDETERLALDRLAQTDSRIEVIHSDLNIGFGAAHNAALRRTGRRADNQYTHYFLLNPDTSAFPDTILELLRAVPIGETVIASPLVLGGDPVNPTVWFSTGQLDVSSMRARHDSFGMPPETISNGQGKPIDFLSGAALFVTRESWQILSGFDEGIFLYWEDVDLSIRARALGISLMSVPSARIWHMEGGSSNKSDVHGVAYYKNMASSRIYVTLKHEGFAAITRPQFIVETGKQLLRAIRDSPGERLRNALAVTRGIIAGYSSMRRRIDSSRVNADSSRQPEHKSRRVLQVVTQLERAGAQTMAYWMASSGALGSDARTRFLYNKSGSDLFEDSTAYASRRAFGFEGAVRAIARLRSDIKDSDIVIAHTHYAIAATLIVGLGLYGSRDLIGVHHWPIRRYPAGVRILRMVAPLLAPRWRQVFVSPSIAVGRNSTVIPNPVPDYAPGEERAVDEDIVIVARHSFEKGLDVALRALPLLCERRMTLVGQGPKSEELKQLASVLGVRDRVKFLGAVPRTQVSQIMRGANVVVLPSRWEAMPMVLLEAVAVGAPLVVSSIPAHQFVLADGAALGFRSEDPLSLSTAISRLDDQDVLSRLAAGRALVRAHQSSKVIRAAWRRLIGLEDE